MYNIHQTLPIGYYTVKPAQIVFLIKYLYSLFWRSLTYRLLPASPLEFNFRLSGRYLFTIVGIPFSEDTSNGRWCYSPNDRFFFFGLPPLMSVLCYILEGITDHCMQIRPQKVLHNTKVFEIITDPLQTLIRQWVPSILWPKSILGTDWTMIRYHLGCQQWMWEEPF